ncbi:MAG: TM2 domain-containing protein [Proteobacteria bacterium]|nr:TM2 domain-containing protein [Pseudomonadota bacterium]
MARKEKSPGVAAVLSMLIPGVGQFYAGHWFWGIVWLIITPGFWIGTGGCLGWICHVLSAIQAANQAADA